MKEHLAGIFAIYAHRCHSCQHRFLRFRYAARGIVPELAPMEREVRATRGAIQWKRKRREFLLYGSGLLLFVFFLYFIGRDRGTSGN